MSWRLRLQYLWRFTVPSEDYCSRRHRLAGAWQKTKGFHGSRVVQFWRGNVLQNKFHIPAVSPWSALSHCWKIFIASASFLTMPESIFLSTATVSVSLQLRKIVDFLRRIMRKTSVIFDYVSMYIFWKGQVQGLNDAIVVRKNVVKGTTNTNKEVLLKGWFHEKNCCSLGFCPNEGGGGPCPNFLSPFDKYIFSSKYSAVI